MAKFVTTCMTCEQTIYAGEAINWCPGVGSWHRMCSQPRSLQAYWDEKQKEKDKR